jgi:hypothetical protein
MALTDPILGAIYGYAPYSRATPIIYGSLMINVLIGRAFAKGNNPARFGVAALLCSSQFFVITNFSVWAMGHLYPHTWAGLTTCYIAALPFFGWTVVGDLLYTAVLFGIYAAVAEKVVRRVAGTENQLLAD